LTVYKPPGRSARAAAWAHSTVKRRPRARVHVADHQVVAGHSGGFEYLPGVGRPDPDAPARRQRQVPADEVGERRVDLGHQLPRPRPGVREVARQRQAPSAQVQDAQRLAGREREVGDVPDALDVLELQVARVVEVDLALRDAVDEKQPRGRSG